MSRKQWPNRALEGGVTFARMCCSGGSHRAVLQHPHSPLTNQDRGNSPPPLGRMERSNCSRWMDPGQLPVTTGGGWGWRVGSAGFPRTLIDSGLSLGKARKAVGGSDCHSTAGSPCLSPA